jgi:RNA polymerase sigma-70 factor (ECF subfamily)
MIALEEFSLRWFRNESATGELDDVADVAPLVEAWSPLLFRIAHSVVRSRAEAEDVVQDTFVRVLEHRTRLPDVRDQRVWLVRIAWNLALDRRRRRRPDQMDDSLADTLSSLEISTDRILAGAQQMQTVLAALDRLPGPEREALVLSAFDELTTAEMAVVLHRSEGAVRALVSRARARLLKRLQQKARPDEPDGKEHG